MLKNNAARTTKTSRRSTTQRTAPKARTLRLTPELERALIKLQRHAKPENIAYERQIGTELVVEADRGSRATGREHLATAELYEALRAAR